MNNIIKELQNHRTYRDFDDNYTLPDTELEEILTAARQAPTWMNGQFYSIIVVKDKAKRDELVRLNPGNPHIAKSSVFLLFLADLNRTQHVAKKKNTPYNVQDNLDALIVATTDAALACGNAVTACESLGLGTVVVGSVRNHPEEYIKLFQLPELVYPLFGLSIGKPTVDMRVKPRLPKETVIHYDTYTPYSYNLIEEYDATMEQFAEARETKLWSQKFADYFKEATLSEITRKGLEKQHFLN